MSCTRGDLGILCVWNEFIEGEYAKSHMYIIHFDTGSNALLPGYDAHIDEVDFVGDKEDDCARTRVLKQLYE